MPDPRQLLRLLDPRRSLRAKVALFLGLSGLVFAALTAAFVEARLRSQLESHIGQALRRDAVLVGQALAQGLVQQLRLVRQLASQPALASGLMEAGDMRSLLEAARLNQPELSWLAVVDPQGRVQVATQTLMEGESVADEAWFRPGLQRAWVGGRHPAGRLKGPFGLTQGSAEPDFIDLAAPLIDPQGRTFGVLVAQLDWAWVAAVHQAVAEAGDAPEQAAAGRAPQFLLLDAESRVEIGPTELLLQPLALAQRGPGPLSRPMLLDWPDGGRYLSAAVDLPVPGTTRLLRVLARQDEASAFGPAKQLRWRLFKAGLWLTLAFVGISVWLAGRLTRPIHALAEAVRRHRLGQQDAGFALPPTGGGDELRDLAGALHDMDRSLREEVAERERMAELYRALFEGSPDANVLLVDGRITMANRRCLDLFGADSVEALAQRGLSGLVHPDDHAQLRARGQALREGARTLPVVEERMRRLDGTVFEVESSVLSFQALGRPAQHVVMRDISERKRADRALAQSEARFQLAMQGTAAGLFDWDVPTGAVEYTATWEALLGEPVAGLPRSLRDWAGRMPPEEARRVTPQLRALAAGEREQLDTELTLQRRDGRPLVLLARAFLVRDEQGAPRRVIGTVLDVTERQQARAALKAANAELAQLNAGLEQRVEARTAELRQANEELDGFSRAVSHDLRSPLLSIQALAQGLRAQLGGALDETGGRYLGHIEGTVQRLIALIDGLLTLSRNGRERLHEGEVPLSLLAQRIVDELRLAEPARQVSVEIAPGLQAHGDIRMIDAALRNLIGNAWKYTARTPDARIVVDQEQDGGRRWFRVSDNGAGFDMQRAGQLFTPFQRLHPQDQFPGIGLGLANVRRIVQRHGGSIEASGAPGQGACFRFTLPDPA